MPDTATPPATPAAQSDPYDIEAAFPEPPQPSEAPAPKPTSAAPATPPKADVAAAPATNFSPAPATPEPAAEPSQTSRSKHSPAVLELARRFGFTSQQILDSSPEELRSDVELAHRMILAEQRRNEVSNAAHAPGPKPGANAPAPVPASERVDDDVNLGIKEEDYDPALIGGIKNAFKALNERNKKLEARLAAYEERDTHRTVSTTAELLDSIFDAMPGREAHYGRGPASGLDKNSGEYKRRIRLIAAAGVDLKNPPSPGRLRQMLHDEDEVIYGSRGSAPAAETESPKRTIQNRDPATGRILPSTNGTNGDAHPYATPTARPTQRTSELPPGDEKAKQLLTDLFTSRGQSVPGQMSEGPDDFLNDFPQ